ncbi:aggrecan core protein-like [Mercenaria mercenaria]|uniref:aggrecan core protein-like n=1 Tax=Mercenaria mercenaria TaxID=6596 RepID=UPI00234E97EF|nr:aggrecan core protein-like [Mercenaria mercenaria]
MLFSTSMTMFSSVRLIGVLMCLMIKSAVCDYSCLCSYQVELEIFEKPDPTSNVDGYMYEFDCKPAYRVDGLDPTYRAIGNEGKLGYILMTSNIQIQTCQGSIPDLDRVKTTSTVPPATTTMQPTTTTTLPTTTTTLPTTKTTPLPTMKITTLPPTTVKVTTILPTSLKTTKITMPPTVSTTTKATTPVQTTQPTTKMTSASPANNCPLEVKNRSKPQYLFQYGNICYEYVPLSGSWKHAQNHCNTTGGHLVSIENENQQTFVSNMLLQIPVTGPVWLGLHDRVNEEQWQLDTGIPAIYTNWEPGRYIDQYHDDEDCGLLIPKHKNRWDDVDCNGITHGGVVSYPWICQYM